MWVYMFVELCFSSILWKKNATCFNCFLLSLCCFAEGLLCHSGSPGNTKTREAGEESILAVEETLNTVLIMTGFVGFDVWYAIFYLKLIRSNMETLGKE